MSQYITAGALIRRPVRRYLLSQNIQFREDKGLLDSIFYLNSLTPHEFDIVCDVVRGWLSDKERA